MRQVDDALLLAVLAGTADPEEVRRVEDAVDASPRIRGRLAELAEAKVTATLRVPSLGTHRPPETGSD